MTKQDTYDKRALALADFVLGLPDTSIDMHGNPWPLPKGITEQAKAVVDDAITQHEHLRPRLVYELPRWLAEHPRPLINTAGGTPWWGRCGESDVFITNGHSLLRAKHPDAASLPVAERFDTAEKAARLVSGVIAQCERHLRKRVTARVLCALPPANEDADAYGVRVRNVKIDARLVTGWVGSAAACCPPTESIEVRIGSAVDPVLFSGRDWTAVVMPMTRFSEGWKAISLRLLEPT